MGGAQVKGEKPECRRRFAFEEAKKPGPAGEPARAGADGLTVNGSGRQQR
jgi:hypothetical protein